FADAVDSSSCRHRRLDDAGIAASSGADFLVESRNRSGRFTSGSRIEPETSRRNGYLESLRALVSELGIFQSQTHHRSWLETESGTLRLLSDGEAPLKQRV